MAEWYIKSDGKKYGPFDSAKLVKLAAAGKLKPTDRVRKGRDGEWRLASSVRRLFDAETQANYNASEQGGAPEKNHEPKSSKKTSKKTVSRKSRPPNKKKRDRRAGKTRRSASPRPASLLPDLSEEVGGVAPLPHPMTPVPAARVSAARRQIDPRRNIGYTLAKASWQMPIVSVGVAAFSASYIFTSQGAPSPDVLRYFAVALQASMIIGFLAGPVALCLIPKYGSKYIVPHASVGTCLHITVLLLVGMLFYDRMQTLDWDRIGQGGMRGTGGGTTADEPLETSDVPYLKRRKAFRSKLTHRGPAPQEYEHERPPEEIEEVTYPSGDLRLKAWVNRSGADSAGSNPALVYFHGGFTFNSSVMEACQPFVDAGFVVMTPMLRGENGGPGEFELFLGEVDDAKAAVRWIATQPDVDPERIYTFGHSVGGGISAMLSLMDDVPIQHGASSGGLYGRGTFDGWSDIVPFDLTDPREREMRTLLGNVRWMKHKHYAYLGDDDVFGSEYERFTKEREEILDQSGDKPLLTVYSVPGDHFTSFEPALQAYLHQIAMNRMQVDNDRRKAERKRIREKIKQERAGAVPPPEPASRPKNPFNPRPVDSEPTARPAEVKNPFKPKDEAQKPFEAGTEPKQGSETEDPFEPATEPANPFE